MSRSGLVTILFTDLVGSTALSQAVGDMAADDLRREHFRALRQAIGRTGGTEVKSIGDALMVSYLAAADAIAGAVAMQQGVDLQGRRADNLRLEMRVGISAGDAAFEDGDWFGTPVVEASRLCSAAQGGQILASDIVRVLAGSRTDYELRSVGEIEAKGLAAPISACEVVWVPVSDRGSRSVPLPSVIDQADPFAFVGRAAELDALLDAWGDVDAGARRVVLVAGEPGIGKSRLVKEVCRCAHDQGGLVLWGGCEEDLDVPYQPFAEALRWYVTTGPIDELPELLGSLGGELVRLVPDLGRLVSGLQEPLTADPETVRYRLFEAVVDLLGLLSARSPVLLVLDDVHWAAKPTLLLLRHVLRASAATRMLIIATYRETDLDRTHPLAEMLADLRREPNVDRLALIGLDEQSVAQFLDRSAGQNLDDPAGVLAPVVHAETEGNPFFIGEVFRHLVDTGSIVARDGCYSVDQTLDAVGIPEGVREVIGRRLSVLDATANDILSVACVVGREFDLGLLANVSDGTDEDVLDALEAAERAGLVVAVPGRAARYRFAHALVRSTLYDELTTSRRLRLHRSIGRALVERPDATTRLAELAHHFSECAALGEVDRAVRYCRLAGETAWTEVAFEEAANYYERALGALDLGDKPDPTTRAELLLAAGTALVTIADPRGRDLLFSAAEIARGIGDSSHLTAAALALSRDNTARDWTKIDEPTIALIEEALDVVDTADVASRALLTSALVHELVWSSPQRLRRLTLAVEALDLARRAGDDHVLVQVLSQQGDGDDHTDAESIGRHATQASEMIRLASVIDDPVALFEAFWHRIGGSIMLGDRATLDTDLDELETLAALVRQPRLELRARTMRAAQTLLSGNLRDAENKITELGEYAAEHLLAETGRIAAITFQLYYEQGRLAELEPLIAQLVTDQPALGVWRVALLTVHTALDRIDDVREHLRALAMGDFALVPRDNVWLVAMIGIASAAALTGELDIAQRAYANLLPFRRIVAFSGVSALQPVALSLGASAAALGRFDEAQQHYSEAVELSQRLEAPTFAAATLTQWAQTLVDPNGPRDIKRAKKLAEQALETANELGLGRIAELSERVLTA